MNKHHRYFIQFMLKNTVSTVANAIKFSQCISKGEIMHTVQFKALVAEINREITKHSFKLVFDICEVTNEEVIVWLNTKNDDISKLQSAFSAVDLEYFHAILQEILNSEEHRITFIVCLNITSTLTGSLSRSNGQKVLEQWIKKGYYIRNGDYIHFGSKLLLEFGAYLKSHCPDAMCSLCSELVFTGRQCENCRKTLHSICLSKYLEKQDKCPNCQVEWIDIPRILTRTDNAILNQFEDENYDENMEVEEEVPDNIFEDYTQLTEEYSNVPDDELQHSGSSIERSMVNRISEKDLLEAGPSSRY